MNDVLAVMQDDWVMMALPFFFGALAIELLWAYQTNTKHYERVDFWTSIHLSRLFSRIVGWIGDRLGRRLVGWFSGRVRCGGRLGHVCGGSG